MPPNSTSHMDSRMLYEERRAFPRVPLDEPYFVTLRKGDTLVPAMLVDLSRGGAQLALSPTESSVAFWLGEDVILDGLPLAIDAAGAGWPGLVSWIRPERCGVRFQPPLSINDAKLIEIIKSL